jgi:hypothetical protein
MTTGVCPDRRRHVGEFSANTRFPHSLPLIHAICCNPGGWGIAEKGGCR